MQALGSPGQFNQVSLGDLRERIEQRPQVSWLEFLMLGIAPLLQDVGNLPWSGRTDIRAADDEIMRGSVIHVLCFVCSNTFILVMPLLHQPANGILRQHRNIAQDEPSMFPGNFDLAAEAEVVADENTHASNDARRKPLIVGIANPKDVGVVVM